METIIFIAASTYNCEQIGRVFRKLSELGGGTLSAAFPVYAGDLGGDLKGAGGKCSVGSGREEEGVYTMGRLMTNWAKRTNHGDNTPRGDRRCRR